MGKHRTHAGRSETTELYLLRRDPAYRDGQLIDKAADVAMKVFRPAHRLETAAVLGRAPLRQVVDFEELDNRYQDELIAAGAAGWAEEMDETGR